MATRVQSLDIWDQDWFIGLDDHYKLFYQYIEDNCSHAGIWAPQKARFERLLSIRKQIDYYKFLEQVNEGCGDYPRIVLLDSGYWFLPHYFSARQGKKLKISSPFHRGVWTELTFHKALPLIQGITNLDEAAADFEEWSKERKKIEKKRLRNSAVHFTTDNAYQNEPSFRLSSLTEEVPEVAPDPSPQQAPAEPAVAAGEPELRKILLRPSVPHQIMPEIEYLHHHLPIDKEIDKFLQSKTIGIWAHTEGIKDPSMLKKLIEYFIVSKIKSAEHEKGYNHVQISQYLNNWYTKVKGNQNFMTTLKEKTTQGPIKRPRMAKVQPPPDENT